MFYPNASLYILYVESNIINIDINIQHHIIPRKNVSRLPRVDASFRGLIWYLIHDQINLKTVQQRVVKNHLIFSRLSGALLNELRSPFYVHKLHEGLLTKTIKYL